ncbi:phage protease, partial [Leminorella grimontii]
MKRKNAQHIGFAVLTATLQSSSDGWYQLLPAGEFRARDGRPTDVERGCWYIDADVAARFIASTVDIGQPVLCDYNHATLREQDPTIAPPSEETQWRAEAAGWLTDPATQMQWREGLGLFVRPTWTDDASAAIDAKKWAFLSAVFPYDTVTGEPLFLRMFALTNDPGLTGMQSLAALAAASLIDSPLKPTQDTAVMNDLLRLILVALGIIATDDQTEYTEEQLKELVATATEKITALKTASETAVEVAEVVESQPTPEAVAETVEQAVDDNADAIQEAEQIIAEAELHGVDLSVAVPVTAYMRLQKKLTTAQLGNASLSASQIIAKAQASGAIVASEVPYFTALARQHGVAALNAQLVGR